MPQTYTSHNHFVIYLALALLSLMGVSCGTVKNYDYAAIPASSHRTPKDLWGNKNKANRHRENNHEDQDGGVAIEQWKSLNIKLGRHDNKALYREIKSWLGTPHKDGEHKMQEGTDCSGFVMEIYFNVYNLKIERNSARIFTYNCYPIKYEELREGDLVFFHNGSAKGITHVGIYLKENMFVHASSSRGVVIDDFTSRYYNEHFYSAGRVIR